MSLAAKFEQVANTQKEIYKATDSPWTQSASHGQDGVALCYFVAKGLQKLCELLDI